MLVSQSCVSGSLLGFNVIEEIILESPTSERASSSAESHAQEKWQPPVNFEHLDQQQQEVVCQMLFEESDVFTRGDGHIGCIPNLQLKINLVDNNPVHKCYDSIPKPVYKEVKEYVQDMQICVFIFLHSDSCQKRGPESAALCGLQRAEPKDCPRLSSIATNPRLA